MIHLFVAQAAEFFPPDWLLWGLALAILVVCLQIYGRLLAHVLKGRGKVWTEPLGLPDLLVVIVLVTWLGGALFRAASRPDHPSEVTDSVIIASATLFGIIVAGITLFLEVRHISVSQLFGFRRAKFTQVLKYGFGLILAAYPLVLLCGALVQLHFGEDTEPQDIVKFFSEAASRSEWQRMALGLISGGIVAPLTEEFIFRGYFYGVFRRNLGIVPALLLTSALFAAIHLNAVAFLPLFVLAVCFTLAYEATGSLLTPILMHVLFNASMFGMIIYKANHP